MKCWQLQEAKAHLSEVIRRSIQQGLQILTVTPILDKEGNMLG